MQAPLRAMSGELPQECYCTGSCAPSSAVQVIEPRRCGAPFFLTLMITQRDACDYSYVPDSIRARDTLSILCIAQRFCRVAASSRTMSVAYAAVEPVNQAIVGPSVTAVTIAPMTQPVPNRPNSAAKVLIEPSNCCSKSQPLGRELLTAIEGITMMYYITSDVKVNYTMLPLSFITNWS